MVSKTSFPKLSNVRSLKRRTSTSSLWYLADDQDKDYFKSWTTIFFFSFNKLSWSSDMIRLKSIQWFKPPYPTQQTYVKAVPFLFSKNLITNNTTRMQKCICWCHILRVFLCVSGYHDVISGGANIIPRAGCCCYPVLEPRHRGPSLHRVSTSLNLLTLVKDGSKCLLTIFFWTVYEICVKTM